MPRWDVTFNTRVSVENPNVIRAVATTEALAKVIRGIPIPPAVQHMIDRLNILRAVRGTTGIEGIELTEDEVGSVIAASPGKRVLPPSRQREEQETRNADQVMRYVAKKTKDEPTCPLTEELVCRIHELTTQGIDYPGNRPGFYREHRVTAATYVPPETGEEVRRLMREFVTWFNEGMPQSWPAVVRALVAHFYVVSIHPFGDGNGRTARGVESFLLFQGGINVLGFYSLANFYYRHRDDYARMLDHVRFETNNDLTPFIQFALDGLVAELETVHESVLNEVKVITFRDFAREALAVSKRLGAKPRERMYHFLLGLTHKPVSLAELRGGNHPLSQFYRHVTPKTLMRDLDFLTRHGLIRVNGGELRANLEAMDQFMP